MTESTYVRRLKRDLEREGAFVLKIRPGNGQRAGVPDLYVAHADFHGWIEAKWVNGRVTEVQRSVIEMIRARGVPVVVLRGPGDEVEDADGNQLAVLDRDYPILPQLEIAACGNPSTSPRSSSGPSPGP